MFPDIVEHAGLSACNWMQTIGLKLAGIVGKAGEQERYQRYMLCLSDQSECRLELPDIVGAVIGRQFHADEQHLRAMPAACGDNSNQISAQGCDRSTAQSVIGAKFDDHNGRMVLLKCSSDAIFPAKGSFTTDTGVDHLIIEFFLLQALLQQIDPTCALWQTVTGGQTVAEYKDSRRGAGSDSCVGA